ncbi:MAG: hypothetical protein N2513_10525 [Deltaproteobacteria bacterium]|nr:hypothetical protein [Deltaproteobacteria bacterium]
MIKKIITVFFANFVLTCAATIITWAIFYGWEHASIPVLLTILFTLVYLLIDIIKTHFKKKRRLYAINELGVAEYVVAKSPEQAFKFVDKLWGGQGMQDFEYWKSHQNPENLDSETDFYDFLDDYIREMQMDEDLNIDGNKKKVSEWCMEAKKCPEYLACEDY